MQLIGILPLLLLGSVACASHVRAQSLQRIASLDLPGAPGKRFDYLKVDSKGHRLFLAHLGADQMYVIGLKDGNLLHTVTGTPGVEGIEIVSELNKAYTSNWRDASVGVVDLTQMRVTKKIPADSKPDGSAYAAPFHKLYVSDERAKELLVIDVTQDKLLTKIHFDSETGMPQYDPIARKVYVNLQDLNLLAVIDPATDKVEKTLSVGTCKGNHGMALDPEHHLVFLACEGNDQLAVFNLDQARVTDAISVPAGVDVISYDAGLSRLYAACYSGFISILQGGKDSHFQKLEDIPVSPKVHSLTVDPETHKVYVPLQEENGKTVSRLLTFDAVVSTKRP